MTERQKWLTTIALMIGLLIASIDETVVGTAVPKITTDLGGASLFTWVVTAYLLTATAVVPVVGKLSDLYGRKPFWMLGIATFMVGSLLCGQADSMEQLILFRAIQGIGFGMIMPIAFTIAGDLFVGEQQAKVQGVFNAVWTLGSLIGPMVGGWLVDMVNWRYIFLINLPIGVVAILFSAWSLKGAVLSQRRKIDWNGSFLILLAVSSLMVALQGGGTARAWGGWQSLLLLATSGVAFLLFIRNELRVEEPILDLRFFTKSTFRLIFLISLLFAACFMCIVIFFPWYIQGVIGASATSSGTVLLPMFLSLMVASIIAGRIVRYLSYRWQIGGGLLLAGLGFFLATRFDLTTSLWQARTAIMLLGFGFGLFQPILFVAAQQGFEATQRGSVTAAITFAFNTGAAVGVTTLGMIFNKQMSHQFHQVLSPRLGGFASADLTGLNALEEKPANLVQLLVQPELRSTLPTDVRQPIIDLITNMTANAILPVFWTALILVASMLLLSQLLGKARLQAQAEAQAPKERTAHG